ncbi:sel1 repeat family protein [Cardiobacteriaceae bacterium TAE3-ERU3]|nr:sel1 repeat family protein [Cardiobacteriaceae bacterium TAE3-ERU3]
MAKRLQTFSIAILSLMAITAVAADCDSGNDCFQKADEALITGNYEQGFELANQGCDKGNADSCAAVGTMYQLGRGVAQDIEQANRHLEQACELGSGDGCAVLASVYLSGQGVAQDLDKAYSMAANGCNVDNAIACMLLGSMQLSGQGSTQDIEAGQANLDKACSMEPLVCPSIEQIRDAAKQAGVIQ